MSAPVIETRGLGYVYNPGLPTEKVALRDVNLQIERGEFVGVIGQTGSGKSTLIQQLNGLLRPTSGQVLIDGEDIWQDKEQLRRFRFKVGLCFQYPEYQLFEESVYKDISFGPKNMGLSEEEVDARVRDAARFVGLGEEMLDKSPFELSGGQKRRVAIAGVLAMDPEVLILDEPTAGLDPRGRDMILGQIKAYHAEKGNTVLLVSHSMEDVAKFATKVLVLNDTGVLLYGTVDEVFSRAEEIRAIGLGIPQITQVFRALRQRGYSVSDTVYTVAQAKGEILRLLAERGAAR
ncbi:energy-coupling factor transporter ATPase [Bittarella sp. HCP28S3_D9]|uniref:energy-coupling factor transporter ATPase n=1 Tax=Bittarella sp. HCP28S3_D9 TaxID=3440253 RepID=UPI003F88915B